MFSLKTWLRSLLAMTLFTLAAACSPEPNDPAVPTPTPETEIPPSAEKRPPPQ